MHGKEDSKQLKALNGIIRTTEQGFELEAHLRHVELIVKQLALENANLYQLRLQMSQEDQTTT